MRHKDKSHTKGPDSEESGLLYRYRFGSAVFDEGQLELRIKDLAVDIEPRPLELLSTLLRWRGQVVSKDSLLDTVWRGEEVIEAVIPSAVKKLRQALTDENAAYIVTVHGKGYRFDVNRGDGITRAPVGRLPASDLEFRVGQPVAHRGDFILDRLLGQSSGGEVWRARNTRDNEYRVFKFATDNVRLTALKREVTLSLLLRAALGERADIATMYGWNFDQRPYYMESQYGGQNLASWASENDRLQSMPVADREKLFLQIAEALRAAHSVGVLHKDLKPANILVAAAERGWCIRLVDFGSGRLLDTAYLRQYGIDPLGLTLTQGVSGDSRSGTPLYLAPELRTGQSATQKSDVYALGLLLYQLMAGDLQRTMAPGWERDINDELLRGDIAAATDGQPDVRLASVDELIERVRSLEWRRTERRRLAESERAAALARRELERSRARRPWLVMVVGSLSAALLVTFLMYRSQEQAHREAERERTRAEAINTFLNDDVLGAADPLTPGGNRDATIKDALARAEGRLDGRFRADPVTKATVELALGRAYFSQTDYARAERFQRAAVAKLETRLGSDDPATLQAEYALVRTLDMRGAYADAEAVLSRLDTHTAEQPQEPSRLTLLALWSRGNHQLMQMHPDNALREFEQAERIREQVQPGDPVWLVRIRGNLAWCYVRLNRNEEAVNVLKDLISGTNTPDELGALDWTKAHLQYGLALTNLSRFQEAEATMRDTIAQSERLLGADNYLTGLAWSHLAATYQAEGHWEDAIDAEKRAYPIMTLRVGSRGQGALAVYGSLGSLEYLSGQLDRAIADLKSAHDLLRNSLGPAAPFTQIVDFYLASALDDSDRAGEAWSLTEHLDSNALSAAEADGHWEGRLQGLKGQILMRTGDRTQGLRLLNSALETLLREKAQPWMTAPLEQAGRQVSGT